MVSHQMCFCFFKRNYCWCVSSSTCIQKAMWTSAMPNVHDERQGYSRLLQHPALRWWRRRRQTAQSCRWWSRPRGTWRCPGRVQPAPQQSLVGGENHSGSKMNIHRHKVQSQGMTFGPASRHGTVELGSKIPESSKEDVIEDRRNNAAKEKPL